MLESFLTIIYSLVIAVFLIIVCGYFWNAWYSGAHSARRNLLRGRPTMVGASQCITTDLRVTLAGFLSSFATVKLQSLQFDLPGFPGLARFLRDCGRDVWVAGIAWLRHE